MKISSNILAKVKLYAKIHILFSYQKKSFVEFLTKKSKGWLKFAFSYEKNQIFCLLFNKITIRSIFLSKCFNSRNFTCNKHLDFIFSYLFLLTSHSSTSAQESPSTPSVLQTAYAKGSMVSSVITEPIRPKPRLTLLLLLH